VLRLRAAFFGHPFSDEELGKLYHDYRGVRYKTLREGYEPGYTLRNTLLGQAIDYGGILEELLKPHLQFPVSILDWGGDTGENTPFKNKCKAFDVFDISNIAVIEGARSVCKQEAMAKQYDLISCCGVLEHVPYPSDLLEDIKKAMHTDSILNIEVPYAEVVGLHGASAIAHKKHWHEHIYFFSPHYLEQLIANSGLKIVAISTDASLTAGLKFT